VSDPAATGPRRREVERRSGLPSAPPGQLAAAAGADDPDEDPPEDDPLDAAAGFAGADADEPLSPDELDDPEDDPPEPFEDELDPLVDEDVLLPDERESLR
jgi:hypothetical protein